MAAKQVGELRGRCLVGNLAHGRAGLGNEKLHADLAGGARVRRRHRQAVGLGAAGLDEALQVAIGRGCVHHDDVRGFGHQADRRHVTVQVVELLFEQKPVQHQRANVGIADGVTVGRGTNHCLGANAATGPHAVFHHDGLTKLAAHLLADQARGNVRVAARGGRHDQGDGPFGIGGVRGRGAKAKQHGGKAGRAFHDDSPGVESCAIVRRPPAGSVWFTKMLVQKSLMVVGLSGVGLFSQCVAHRCRAQRHGRAQ
ncbi:hypothetical protein D3C73_1022330 [compost metagenome]